MTIGIIGAMDEEIEILKEAIESRTEKEKGGCLFLEGSIASQDVIVVKSGIGKVNAAIATALLVSDYQPEYVINTGSAGGFHKDLNVGDIVISTEVRYHDVDVTAFNYEYGQVPGMPASFKADPQLIEIATKAANQVQEVQVAEGLIASGDSFMSDAERVAFVTSKFPEMLASEMEAAAIAQTCVRFGVPFVVIRSLSDIAGKNSQISFEQFLQTAAKHSAAVVQNILKELKTIG
ncbi:MAG TPA: 5'-methylthioadenosine/S-adenosylhomocysteine nucleosidase [Bacillales bacterium]|nr:5'-methylthioadenosine/S-adenosylhomocysteine nucleosidase [Bacillales bacterium]